RASLRPAPAGHVPADACTLSLHDALPIYGESGGQLGDAGYVVGNAGRAQVLDTQKPVGGLVVHRVKMLEGAFEVGEKLEMIVDKDRKSTRLNSSHVKISYAVFCLKKKTRD